MANVHFLGDLHLDHKNVCKFRDTFESVTHHNDVIKDNYHKVVTKRDKVFFMGDVAFSKESLQDLKSWSADRKVLILGNHDLERGVTMKELCDVYDEIYSLYKYKEFWLSHAPIHQLELRGKFNIHGHVHYKSIPCGEYINVSMENINYTPIDLQSIRDIIYKPTKEVD
jgi:calcineurin-like phosphoesterase family protein